jgi:two-component system, sensor histidine kinase and response regulator
VYALPHEVRTPLAVGYGYAGLLHSDAKHLAAEDVQQMAEQIMTSFKRLNRLLENFLVYAQIEVLASDAEQLEQLRNHITGHVGQVVEARAGAVADKYLRRDDLLLDIHDFAARIAENDLSKIVDELVDNAFKFSQSGSPVRVRVSRDAQDFCIEVSDRGHGMSDEQIELVGAYMQFDRALFEQQGLGLGLNIAKRLAELHRGFLAIQSKVGVGTVIRVTFGSP